MVNGFNGDKSPSPDGFSMGFFFSFFFSNLVGVV